MREESYQLKLGLHVSYALGSHVLLLHQLELIVNEADKPLPYRVYIFVIAVTCISAQFWREKMVRSLTMGLCISIVVLIKAPLQL